MATLEELKEELAQAKADLRWMRLVPWGYDINRGMVDYSNQLARCNQLQLRIQRAEQEAGG